MVSKLKINENIDMEAYNEQILQTKELKAVEDKLAELDKFTQFKESRQKTKTKKK